MATTRRCSVSMVSTRRWPIYARSGWKEASICRSSERRPWCSTSKLCPWVHRRSVTVAARRGQLTPPPLRDSQTPDPSSVGHAVAQDRRAGDSVLTVELLSEPATHRQLFFSSLSCLDLRSHRDQQRERETRGTQIIFFLAHFEIKNFWKVSKIFFFS